MSSSNAFIFYLIVLKLVINRGVMADVRFTIDGQPSNVTVLRGETLELECRVTGVPLGDENEYVSYWLSKTGYVKESDIRRFAIRYEPVPDDHSMVTAVYSINITRANDTDQGFYRCLLYHNGHIHLESENAFVRVIRRLSFRRQLSARTVAEGQNVTLGCTLESYFGAYKVKWFRRGHIISEDRTIIKTNESYYDSLKIQGKIGSGNFDLHINNISRELSGKFQCKVFTEGYKKPKLQSRNAKITVRYPPRMLSPLCNSSNINNSFVEGEVIEATCWAQGGNAPVYFEWTKDGKIDSGTLEESDSLYVGKMRWNVTVKDDGKYISCAMKGFAILNERQCTIGPIHIQSTQVRTFISTEGYSKTFEALASGSKMTTYLSTIFVTDRPGPKVRASPLHTTRRETIGPIHTQPTQVSTFMSTDDFSTTSQDLADVTKMATWPSTSFITDKWGPTVHTPPSHTTNSEFKATAPSAFTFSFAKGSLIPFPPADKLASRIMYATIALAIILMAVVVAIVVLYVDSRKTHIEQSAFEATIEEENQGQAEPANKSQNDDVDTNPTEEPSEKSEENREESV